MKVLIVGNMGYVGPLVVRRLRTVYPKATLVGFDTGYFAHCLTACGVLPECYVDQQYFGDVRHFPEDVLTGIDVIVYLAAISNDPMGAEYEQVTLDVNQVATVRLADVARFKGVSRFVFASSCSVYGAAPGRPRTEDSDLNPLTAYARSKVIAEQQLAKFATDSFVVTCLRFATACGMSPRLRLDLVLNDFVATALVSRQIAILSDGTPWRPLIHVHDMARAIEWGVQRRAQDGGAFVTVNAGSNAWNYQVRELAEAVAKVIPGISISINSNAQPDKRSYQVCFDKFAQLAPRFQPEVDLLGAVTDLRDGLKAMGFNNAEFRGTEYIRLNVLRRLRMEGELSEDLYWAKR